MEVRPGASLRCCISSRPRTSWMGLVASWSAAGSSRPRGRLNDEKMYSVGSHGACAVMASSSFAMISRAGVRGRGYVRRTEKPEVQVVLVKVERVFDLHQEIPSYLTSSAMLAYPMTM